MKGVKHYTKDGKEHKGTSKKLVHFQDLSQAAKKKAKK